MAQQFPIAINENAQVEPVASRGTIRLILTAMRPHQWTKNLFLLAPLLFGMKLGEQAAVLTAAAGMIAFCLLSSGLYLLNDIVDAEADRAHPQKRLRPIASGALSTPIAIVSMLFLLTCAFVIAFLIGVKFGLLAMGYCLVTLAYCFAFKHAIVLDGMLIATGFVLRVVAGAIAVNVIPTHWLIVCAFLLALFLAFSKRRQELLMLSAEAAQHRKVLGLYTVGYLDRANNILLAATIVCYALYTVAPETVQRFGTDKLIYGSVFVIYGLLRYLALLQNCENGGNPSKMLLKDMPLLLAIIGWAIYNFLIIYRLPLKFL
jgi:4-hydroxybenzoate polyprenyltransferase